MFQYGSAYVRPLARFLKVVAQDCSIGLQEAIVDFGAEGSFALAAERVLRHHGIELSESNVLLSDPVIKSLSMDSVKT